MMHPRNIYKTPPDFNELAKIYPEFRNVSKLVCCAFLPALKNQSQDPHSRTYQDKLRSISTIPSVFGCSLNAVFRRTSAWTLNCRHKSFCQRSHFAWTICCGSKTCWITPQSQSKLSVLTLDAERRAFTACWLSEWMPNGKCLLLKLTRAALNSPKTTSKGIRWMIGSQWSLKTTTQQFSRHSFENVLIKSLSACAILHSSAHQTQWQTQPTGQETENDRDHKILEHQLNSYSGMVASWVSWRRFLLRALSCARRFKSTQQCSDAKRTWTRSLTSCDSEKLGTSRRPFSYKAKPWDGELRGALILT